MKTLTLILSASTLILAGCGKGDDAAKGQSKKSQARVAAVPLSTAPIDVVKDAQYGMVSENFDPCVYAPAALVSHFGFPADTQASARRKDRRCFYNFRRSERESTAPFANFTASMSLVFDNGLWAGSADPAQYDADINTYISQYPVRPSDITGLGARTFKTKAPQTGHAQMLLGFPVGGAYSATLQSAPVTAGIDSPPISPVYQVDFDRFHSLAANLNARLAAPSSVTP